MDANKEASARRLLKFGAGVMLAGGVATLVGLLLLVGLVAAIWLGL